MNTTLELLKNRSSCREFYANFNLDDSQLELIIEASKQAPSWMNGQAYSIIILRGDDKKKFTDILKKDYIDIVKDTQIKQIEDSSVFFFYCGDLYRFYKILGDNISFNSLSEPLITATTDTALAAQSAQIAASSLGLGSVVMGTFRIIGPSIAEILKLPKYVFPIFGLAIGKPISAVKKDPKPRLPKEISVFYGQYNSELAVVDYLNEYDLTMFDFAKKSNYTTQEWTELFKNYYKKDGGCNAIDNITNELLKKQGF